MTPNLVSLGRWKTHDCTAGEVCLVCGREASEPPARPPRHYHCPACDIFGKGLACWGCDSIDVEWGVIPKYDFDMTC